MPEPWGGEDPLEKEMTTHSSILAWRIPWTVESGGQRVGHVWSNLAHMQRCPCPNSWNPVGFPGGSMVKNLLANAGDSGLIPGPGRSPLRREWQHTLVFSPEESHAQRSLGRLQYIGSRRVWHDWATKTTWMCYLSQQKGFCRWD